MRRKVSLIGAMLQPAIVVGGTVLLLHSGCGGRVEPGGAAYMGEGGQGDVEPFGDGGAPGSGSRAGRSGGTSVGGGRPSSGGRPVGPPPRTCGNGVRDAGEECDGFPGDMTCNSATMGAFPTGTLYCTPDCFLDTSGCRSNSGVGGSTSTGGVTGSGGMPSWQQACFDEEGVPLSGAQGCAYGDEAARSCMVDYWGPSNGGCAVGCGCGSCPGTMAECATDLACTWILSCAIQSACGTLASCYESFPACADLIDRSGGRQSTGSRLARSALTCLTNAGCPTGCL